MYLNGLILLSGLLDFATLREGPGNVLPSLVFLPAYTATAHFHKKLPPDLQADLPKALAEAREFIKAEYPAALWQGAALPEAQRKPIVAKLARLTGLPDRVIEANNAGDDFPQETCATRADPGPLRCAHHGPRRDPASATRASIPLTPRPTGRSPPR
jgi:hypothetical protein